jgi:diadenosine tetraphosphate (Ap4A) HIT family hydrolase
MKIAPDNCIFCGIVAGNAPASVVYEDDTCLAVLDIRPVTAGHTLVIPKRHAACLADLDEETGAHLFRVAMRLAQAIRQSGLRCEGINLFLADGEAAFQEVFHVHLHVFPRYQGDSFRIEADWSVKPAREELHRVAHQLRASYQTLWGSG